MWLVEPVGILVDARASADWMSTALTSSGYSADFSPQTVWELEQAPNGVAKEGGLLSENLGSRLFAVGATWERSFDAPSAVSGRVTTPIRAPRSIWHLLDRTAVGRGLYSGS